MKEGGQTGLGLQLEMKTDPERCMQRFCKNA